MDIATRCALDSMVGAGAAALCADPHRAQSAPLGDSNRNPRPPRCAPPDGATSTVANPHDEAPGLSCGWCRRTRLLLATSSRSGSNRCGSTGSTHRRWIGTLAWSDLRLLVPPSHVVEGTGVGDVPHPGYANGPGAAAPCVGRHATAGRSGPGGTRQLDDRWDGCAGQAEPFTCRRRWRRRAGVPTLSWPGGCGRGSIAHRAVALRVCKPTVEASCSCAGSCLSRWASCGPCKVWATSRGASCPA